MGPRNADCQSHGQLACWLGLLSQAAQRQLCARRRTPLITGKCECVLHAEKEERLSCNSALAWSRLLPWSLVY